MGDDREVLESDAFGYEVSVVATEQRESELALGLGCGHQLVMAFLTADLAASVAERVVSVARCPTCALIERRAIGHEDASPGEVELRCRE